MTTIQDFTKDNLPEEGELVLYPYSGKEYTAIIVDKIVMHKQGGKKECIKGRFEDDIKSSSV